MPKTSFVPLLRCRLWSCSVQTRTGAEEEQQNVYLEIRERSATPVILQGRDVQKPHDDFQHEDVIAREYEHELRDGALKRRANARSAEQRRIGSAVPPLNAL